MTVAWGSSVGSHVPAALSLEASGQVEGGMPAVVGATEGCVVLVDGVDVDGVDVDGVDVDSLGVVGGALDVEEGAFEGGCGAVLSSGCPNTWPDPSSNTTLNSETVASRVVRARRWTVLRWLSFI